MYVCICRKITDSQIRQLCDAGVASLPDIRKELGVASDCGRCGKHAREVIREYQQSGSSAAFFNAATA